MHGQRHAQAPGLIRVFALALRVCTRVAWVGRRPWAAAGPQRAGLSAGNPQRATDRPPAERRLEAFEDMTLTSIRGAQQTAR